VKQKMLLGAVGAALLLSGAAAMAQVNDRPWTEHWFPSRWGADDSAGSSNHTKNPANVKRAIGVIKQFKVVTLGKYYMHDSVFFGPRSWNMVIPGTPTGGPFGKNALVYHDEYVTTEIGQVSTQLDGPGHIGVRTSKGDVMYNGRMREEVYERGPGGRVIGMGKNGVEFIAENGFVCRAVLLNAPAYRGMARLPIPHKPGDPGIVTADDVKAIMRKEGLSELMPGDCVFLYTGHGDLWRNKEWKSLSTEERAKRRAEFNSGEPGYGLSACQYFVERNLALQGGDTSANDAQPGNEVEGWAVPCHTEAQVRTGLWNLENLDFTPLLEAGVYEFAFFYGPIKAVGATGAPGNPIAIY